MCVAILAGISTLNIYIYSALIKVNINIINQGNLQCLIQNYHLILADELWSSYGVFTSENFTSTLFVDTGVCPGVSGFRLGLMSLRWSNANNSLNILL